MWFHVFEYTSEVENSEISNIQMGIFHTMGMRRITGIEIFLRSTKLISAFAIKKKKNEVN